MNRPYSFVMLMLSTHWIPVACLGLFLENLLSVHAATASADSNLTVVDTRGPRLPGGLSGTIISSSGSPIPNAAIVLINANRRTTSDASGKFALTDVPPGSGDVVTISAPGYLASRVRQIAVSSERMNNLGTIVLTRAPEGALVLSPLSPDVNPPDGQSSVEEGGEALRYFQLRRGLQPAAGVKLTVRRETGEELTDLSGGPTDSPGLQKPESDSAGLVRVVIPTTGAGRGRKQFQILVNDIVLTNLSVNVIARRFDQVWKESVGGGATAKASLFRSAIDGSIVTSVTQPCRLFQTGPFADGPAKIESEWDLELKSGVEIGLGMSIGPVRAGIEAGVGIKSSFAGSETFQIAEVDNLDPSKSTRQLYASSRRLVAPVAAGANWATGLDSYSASRAATAWLDRVVKDYEVALHQDLVESYGEVEVGGYGSVDLELQGRLYPKAGLGLKVEFSAEASAYRRWAENIATQPGSSEARLGTRQQLDASASILGSGDFRFQHLDKSLKFSGSAAAFVDQSVAVAEQGDTTRLRSSRGIGTKTSGDVGTSGWSLPDFGVSGEKSATITEDLEVVAKSPEMLSKLTDGEVGWKFGPDQAIANLVGPQEPLRIASSLVTAAGREGVPVNYERQWEAMLTSAPVNLDFELDAAISGIGMKLNAEYSQGARAVYERGVIVGQRRFATEFYPRDPGATFPTESLLVKQARWARASSSVINVAATILEDPVAAVKRTMDFRNIRDGAKIVEAEILTPVKDTVRGWLSPDPSPVVGSGPRRSARPAGLSDAYIPSVNSSNWIYGVMGVVHLQSSNTFQGTAKLNFYYVDDALVGLIPEDLRVYRQRMTNGLVDWDFVGGTVDPANRTVTVTASELGTFCLAPPMPRGRIDLIGSTNLLIADGQASMEISATNLVLNTGEPLPNRPPFEGGYLYTVQAEGVQITGLDAEPALPGFQVAATNGVLRLSILSPNGGTQAKVRVRSVVGNAVGILPIPLLDQASPGAPTNVTAVALSGSRIRVLWKTNSEPDLAGYRVYYMAGPTAPSATDRAAWNGTAAIDGQPSPVSIPGAGTVLRGLNPDSDYFVGLIAVDLAGNESIMTVAGPVHTRMGDPAPPTDAVVRFSQGGTALLSWSLSEDDDLGDRSVARYEIWRQALPGGQLILASQVPAGIASFEESLPDPGADHFFRYVILAADQEGRVSAQVVVRRLLNSGPGNDMDGDGMPDWWEGRFGLSDLDPADARDDQDNDGADNLAEYIAGTNPLDSSSRLVLHANLVEGILRLSWPSVTGKTYRLERSPYLGGHWELVAGGQAAEPPSNLITIPSADSQSYFRIVVE